MLSGKDENELTDQVVGDIEDDEDEEDIGEQTIVMSDVEDLADPDISMEVNVEKLVAHFEKADKDDVHRRAEIRRRLEELTEDGSLEDTYAIDFDD